MWQQVKAQLGMVAIVAMMLLWLGVGVFVTSRAAHADPDPSAPANAGRTCALQSAKNTDYFEGGTQFQVKTFSKLYTYTCNAGEERWDETIFNTRPIEVVPSAGTALQ